jgi:hypothetical protein
MVYTPGLFAVVWQSLKVRLSIVVSLPDAGKASDAKRSKTDDVGGSKVVDVRGNPTAVVKLEQVIAGFMVASDEDG